MISDKQKIFLVIPTLKQGGAERVMSELANQWASENHEVHMILLAKGDQFYTLHKNVIVHELAFENLGRLKKIISEINVFFKLRNLLKKERPDFVLSFMTKYNILTILASRFLNLKVFVSDRSNPKKKMPFTLDILSRFSYRYATGIIAQTSLAKDMLIKVTKNNNIKVIPNPVKDIKKSIGVQKENIILNVGRLVPEKGQKYLIETFSNLNKGDWKLVILGEGSLKEELKNQIVKLGLQDSVYMLGAVQNVDKWLRRSSIFAFPSISEGFPNALLEAMSAGLPCVSFDCDAGPRDVIKNGENGFIVPTYDVSLFTVYIEKLVNNQALRAKIGNKAEITASQFETKLIADKYLEFCSLDID